MVYGLSYENPRSRLTTGSPSITESTFIPQLGEAVQSRFYTERFSKSTSSGKQWLPIDEFKRGKLPEDSTFAVRIINKQVGDPGPINRHEIIDSRVSAIKPL